MKCIAIYGISEDSINVLECGRVMRSILGGDEENRVVGEAGRD